MNEPAASAEPDTCAVCGKVTANGRGYMQLQAEGRMIELCCPMCLKVFQDRQAQRQAEEDSDGGKYLGWDEKW
ncbi:MAG: hypothetical protein Q8M02_15105 [Candidatus Didemnitutus sp.]|nr:hypothetical protein [Candidatus Didemnitutus sp.]